MVDPKPPRDAAGKRAAGTRKRTARPRAPGRPAAAAGKDHQAGLLDAALACFAEQGIAGTRMRDVAQRAGVTPALVNYYFGDKEQLLRSVVETRLRPVAAGLVSRLVAAGDDLPATVRGFVEGMAAVVEQNPWWPQLWVREVLCEGGALRGLLIDEVGPQVARMMVARFADAQARGELNPGLDPRLLMTSLVGLTMFPAAGAPIWRRLLGAEELGMDAVAGHALALLWHGAWSGPR
ncbi:TetR/AcrR family transcriptional regulator [[Pseudomonas] boreopolis]|uniref:TetR/AcrR family transcriptional regulator n=1 Tax=Xanthomonas boreopolis TaxID=86183 RepID=UPI003D9FF990